MTFEKRAIRSTIKSQLAEHKSKNDVYNELRQQFSHVEERRQIADWIRYTPEPQRLKKYGIYNTLFLLLLSGLLLCLLFISNYSGTITLALLILIVADRNTKYYYILSVFGFLTVIMGAGLGIYHLFIDEDTLYQLLYIAVSLILGGLFIYFGLYYPDLLTPPYEIVEETKTNADGKQVRQRRVVFT